MHKADGSFVPQPYIPLTMYICVWTLECKVCKHDLHRPLDLVSTSMCMCGQEKGQAGQAAVFPKGNAYRELGAEKHCSYFCVQAKDC